VIFGVKAAPGYEIAKNIVHLIYCIARKINSDTRVNDKLRVIFVENYNVSKAEVLIPAADLSEQISTAGMEASGTGNMKLAINGALTIGTEDGANIEMHQQVTDKWWPFSFGNSSEENRKLKESRSYNPWTIYHSLAETETEHQAISSLYHVLLESQYSDIPDRYFVLNDLQSFYDTQKKVESLFLNPKEWAKYAIHNMAAMGAFSTDQSIHNYATHVWGLKAYPVDKQNLEKVRAEYSEHDKCRIL
jgi:glycogen phosphorylase